MDEQTRRAYLIAIGTTAIAGCLGGSTPGSDEDATPADDEPTPASDDEPAAGGKGPPTADRALPLPDDTATLNESHISGGVPKDGIPSIDEPQYSSAEEADEWLDSGDPVFGVERDGDVRAYAQRILVTHEIVNTDLAGESVAVTYCPLTGTAQGFARGDTEFGVSGQLLNSNLIMYDRATDSYWPQMLAVGIRGPHEGDFLQEFPVTWTTWERWRETHPETTVLSQDTGFARSYDHDPYGSYNPPSGHYADESLPFAPYTRDEEHGLHPKEAVIGTRSPDGALAVVKDRLREDELVEADVGGVRYVVVSDRELDTGYVYRDPDGTTVDHEGATVGVDGNSYDPDSLPLDRVLCYDAMWFAWYGYYPDTEVLA